MGKFPKTSLIPSNESRKKSFSIPLSLSAKLSQSYLHEIVLGLLLALVSLCILQAHVRKDGDRTKDDISKACTDLEIATNALASTPFFLAKGVNHFIADSFDIAKHRASQITRLTLTLLKDLFLYILFRYQKVLQCIIYLVISSGLDLVSNGAQEITNFVNQELASISTALRNGLQSLEGQLRTINDATSRLSVGAFGMTANVPKIPLPLSLPGVSDNLKWTLPNMTASFLSSFSKLPSLSSLESQAKEIISAPFDSIINSVSAAIDDALKSTDSQSTFNALPLPSKIDSITFCKEALPLSAVDKVISKMELFLWISISILIGLILCSILVNARSISNSHKLHQAKIDQLITQLKSCDFQEMTAALHLAMFYPELESFLSKFNIQLSDLPLWMAVFCSHPLALMCMIVGGIGIFVTQMQLVLIPWIASLFAPIVKEEIKLAAHVIEEKIGGAIDQTVGPFVAAVNIGISEIEEVLNLRIVQEMKTIVGSIDSGVTILFSSFQKEMDQIFNVLPPLKSAVSSFFTCVVGNVSETLATLETNLESNSIVNITRITSNHFEIDAALLLENGKIAGMVENFVQLWEEDSASTGANALFQSQIDKFLQRYESIIWLQTLPFLVLFLFGFSVILCGLIMALHHLFTQPRENE